MSTYKVKITFITGPLGSQPQKDVASEYIATKVADRVSASGAEPALNGAGIAIDEEQAMTDELERGTTVFFKDEDGNPIFFDYQIKGFLKEAAQVFNGKLGGVKNLRSKIDNTVFVEPRTMPIEMPDGGAITFNERPLRAQTAQGPRTALARSEQVPALSTVSFELVVLPGEITEKIVRGLLDYGYYKGIGQWRNGGNGRFNYETEEVAE